MQIQADIFLEQRHIKELERSWIREKPNRINVKKQNCTLIANTDTRILLCKDKKYKKEYQISPYIKLFSTHSSKPLRVLKSLFYSFGFDWVTCGVAGTIGLGWNISGI